MPFRSGSSWARSLALAAALAGFVASGLASSAAAARAGTGARVLDAELDALLETLPGRYAGPIVASGANAPPGGSAAPAMLHHKIVPIELPQLGETVIYHQIARDGFDSPRPFQQKLYVFDRSATRSANRMRSFVVPPGMPIANLESDADARNGLDPAKLQSFPESCAIRWSVRGTGEKREFVARVRRQDCRFPLSTSGETVSADLTYVVSSAAFVMEDLIFRADGSPLFPSSGPLRTPRVAPAVLRTAADVLAATSPSDWRRPAPDDLLLMQFGGRRVVIELAPAFAPAHAANLRALARARWFDGMPVSRVQDNFVTQWGDAQSAKPLGEARAALPAEFERRGPPPAGVAWLPDPDGFAARVGHLDGFPIGAEADGGTQWLAHCYGMVGAGRDNAPDSSNGTELYAVIGHGPRQLDRNITLVGRVLQGMDALANLPRGGGAMGFYERPTERTILDSVRLVSDLPESERPRLEVLRTESLSFARLVEARRNRQDGWYVRPAGYIDLCNVPVPVREAASP